MTNLNKRMVPDQNIRPAIAWLPGRTITCIPLRQRACLVWYSCLPTYQTGSTGNVCLFVFGFYIPPTTRVIWGRDLALKSHPKEWWCWGTEMSHDPWFITNVIYPPHYGHSSNGNECNTLLTGDQKSQSKQTIGSHRVTIWINVPRLM